MKGNLATTLQLHGTGSQSDGSSLIGRKYLVRDAKYGHPIGEYDNPDEAKNAMLARPYSKVTSQPDIAQTPAVRDLARKRLVKTNPDVDAGGQVSGRHKGSGKLVWECSNCGTGMYEKDIKKSSSGGAYCKECGAPKSETQEDRDKALQQRYKI